VLGFSQLLFNRRNENRLFAQTSIAFSVDEEIHSKLKSKMMSKSSKLADGKLLLSNLTKE
jgi:hypothetical protein